MCPKTSLLLIVCCVASCNSQWKFPASFRFGVATSAYQIEGGYNADGKGVSVWDRITQDTPQMVVDGSNGNVACDSYHKWQEDVEMVKNLNVSFYRFSLSWTRILPNGYSNKVNQAGVDYYNNLIDALLANGIEPMVTIFHWDSPEMFTSLGGFYSENFIKEFKFYAETVFGLFGDRVKTWITFNEPKVLCQDYSEIMGQAKSVYPNGVIEYKCTHVILKSHVEAYHLYRKKFKPTQQGKVGITLNFEWYEPATDSVEDQEAAEQRRQFEFGLYANPVIFGDYPQIVKNRVAQRSKEQNFAESRLPQFSFLEKLSNMRSIDFLGVNHYNSWLAKAAVDSDLESLHVSADIGATRYLDPNWELTDWNGSVVPEGLRHLLQWLKNTYNNPDIYITECGYPDLTGTLEDDRRISFFQRYLNATLQALVEDKVNVKAFTAWSLMDNFEWAQGYTIKFGLYHVDFDDENRTRTPKKSVEYYKNVILTGEV